MKNKLEYQTLDEKNLKDEFVEFVYICNDGKSNYSLCRLQLSAEKLDTYRLEPTIQN